MAPRMTSPFRIGLRAEWATSIPRKLLAGAVDEMTDVPSDKNRECAGLGVANIAASCVGGMAGCGMIAQAVSNVKYGGRAAQRCVFALKVCRAYWRCTQVMTPPPACALGA